MFSLSFPSSSNGQSVKMCHSAEYFLILLKVEKKCGNVAWDL
uniref:Uncharacterized protein n=1 Tax=Rhizophora mucronata TaxID=61149 RepID=A0A2P2ING4_RHIMU